MSELKKTTENLILRKVESIHRHRDKADDLLHEIIPLLEQSGLAKGYSIQWTTDGPSLFRNEDHPEWNARDIGDHFLSNVIEELKNNGVYK